MSWIDKFFGENASSTWSSEQQKRLQFERTVLSRYFPAFNWENPRSPGLASISGTIHANSGRRYDLHLKIPIDIPNSVPGLFVRSPHPLYDHWGKSLVEYGVSRSMHLLGPEHGYIKICHYHPSHWRPELTFYKVLVKGRIWIEAYEGHRTTGKPIDYYLKHQS